MDHALRRMRHDHTPYLSAGRKVASQRDGEMKKIVEKIATRSRIEKTIRSRGKMEETIAARSNQPKITDNGQSEGNARAQMFLSAEIDSASPRRARVLVFSYSIT